MGADDAAGIRCRLQLGGDRKMGREDKVAVDAELLLIGELAKLAQLGI